MYALLIIILLALWYWNADFIGRLIYPLHYQEEIMHSAGQYLVDPFVISAIIRVESNFRTDLVSSKGATGIMQLMPETARWIAEQSPEFSEAAAHILETPTINIRMGTWYIRYLYDYFHAYFETSGIDQAKDQLAIVAASYNAGQGTVREWLTTGKWDGKLDTSAQIPYQETRHYVQRVHYYYKKYRNLYNELTGTSTSSTQTP
jgi:soluble lytic murein transglycosylase